jgi:hypothetical protein
MLARRQGSGTFLNTGPGEIATIGGAHYNMSMASRVAAAFLLVCVSIMLAIFANGPIAAGTGAASPTSSPAATVPPTPTAATQAFGRWLRGRYGSVEGYWTCPIAQRFDNRIDCLAELHVAVTRHLTSATAMLSGAHVVFSRIRDTAWVRRWSPYSRRYLTGPQSFNVPGKASENSPAFDWAFIAQGAAGKWQRHRAFHVDGYDGYAKGWSRFFDFACSVQRSLVVCANSFGDAMRYKPVP